MKPAAAIAVLCLRRWKWLPVGALLLGGFGAYAPFDWNSPGAVSGVLVGWTCVFALAAFVPVITAPIGPAGGPDFLFARPVNWWTVWLGRAAAFLVVSALSVVAVSLPAYVLRGVFAQWLTSPPLERAAVIFFVLGGLASMGTASYRARRPVATLAASAAVFAGMAALYPLLRIYTQVFPLTVSPALAVGLFTLLILPLLAFSCVYLAVGRGEPVRAAVAGGIAAVVACAPSLLFSGWVLTTLPRHDVSRANQTTTSPENTTRSGTVVNGRPSNDTSKR